MGIVCSGHDKQLVMLSVEPMLQMQLRMCSSTTTCKKQFQRNNGSSTLLHHIKTACQPGRLKKALRILQFPNNPIDSSAYVSLLQGCIQKRSLSQSKFIHANKNGTEYTADRISANTLVNMYVKCGSLRDARKVFDEMPRRNVRSWTVMIAGYARQGLPKEAVDLFDQMQSSGVQPNQFTFSAVLPACSNLGSQERGLEIHEQIISSGFQCDTIIQTALIDMYAKCGNMVKARELFDGMPQLDVFSWTAMIAGYAQNGQQEEALEIFRQMERAGLKADVKTLASVLPACTNLTALKNGMEVHGVMIRREFQLGVIMESALVDMYGNCGSMEIARKLFNKMPRRDVLSWTVMIKGCAQNGEAWEALKLFEQMEQVGTMPDQKTFTTVLSACANLAAVEKGMDIHEKIARLGLELDVAMVNSLIDMYAKCGRIEKAREMFDEMHERDVTTWTSMISGYAINGRGKEALKLFEEMKQSCISPNHVTMLCVLSACAHAGLVEQGFQYFDCLSKFYHIQPMMEHYCCMVDLLGRAGRLDEAQDFINKMPIKPDATLWTSLLGACAIYNHVELGERLADFLFEMDPHNPSPYVLLSNIYAAAGRWDDTEKIWKMMKEKGVKKTPGCSWIEVNKQVHAFLVQDRSRQ
ncbi:pentatricopeptide repeat-containing protein At2g13600 [Cryptomeria japonica]|uniref:pentatricopeptide repeat-containing protein At2g13600 n=1 Tax=Cryptomeria japonica TaxID=3369 RepID=UPI0027D9E60C|nr:pentatricopeptide repeat-containing protein At2g13600 [Cryptomeria japonica]